MSAYPNSSKVLTNASQVWVLERKLNVNEFRKNVYTTYLGSGIEREIWKSLLPICHVNGYVFKKKGGLNLDDRIQEKTLKDGNM